MVSIINYKFRSMKNFSTITIEGNGLPLWELKYEIITQKKMQSKDFDLLFYESATNEKITDEYYQIERNSHIIVERIPLWMSSTGYNVRDKKKETVKMPKYKAAPPETYVCFRCGNKGHFIQHCPTNEDKAFDIARIRKPSGIPKDFLIPVKEPDANVNTGMLVTPEGYYVKAQPQIQEWKRNKLGTSNISEIPEELKCPVCNNLFSNPILTNCGHTFCEGCFGINSKCQVCKATIKTTKENTEKRKKVDSFLNK
ncbi:E3 ubiquitin-protein ligase RBBP6 [Vairimorpha necatrix]|uniref:E3 ubiquitin-protein ligase RBBP6 n=1 Tax=Vairimorpha necatrix TaxID=6039 RepID=A0AAX4JA35_9MICR